MTTPSRVVPTAAALRLYLRRSLDADAQADSLDNQRSIARALVARMGWVGDAVEYVDDDRKALFMMQRFLILMKDVAEFVPELVHNQSGAGSQVLAVDLNKDGSIDLVTSTTQGTFVFFGKPRPSKSK